MHLLAFQIIQPRLRANLGEVICVSGAHRKCTTDVDRTAGVKGEGV